MSHVVDEFKAYDQCPLQNGRTAAAAIFEITGIPSEDNSVKAISAYMEITNAFFDLLNEMHSFVRACDTCMEVLLASEKVSDQTYNARIRPYLILRAIADNGAIVNGVLLNQDRILAQVLSSRGFTFKRVNANNEMLLGVLMRLNSQNKYALTKAERIITARCPVTEFYYFVDIIPTNKKKTYDKILEMLSGYPNTAVSFQLLPTRFDLEEAEGIGLATALLNKLSVGFMDDYYGEIRDNLAETPCERYTYYNNNLEKPVYLYNIIAFSQPDMAIPLLTKVESHLNDGDTYGKIVNFDKTNISDVSVRYHDDFFTFPWNINGELVYNRRNASFWETEEAPKSLMRLPFIITSEEASAFFKLPVAIGGHLAGITVAKRTNQATTFEEGVIDNQNIQFGRLGGGRESIGIGITEMTKHIFVAGTPGSGKTTLCQRILYQLHERSVPFLVIEPAKSEYRALVDVIPGLQVFIPGNDKASPFMINPFLPPKKVQLKNYKATLISAFAAAFSMAAPLDKLFLEAVNICYGEHGWRDYSTSDDADVTPFGLLEFTKMFKRVVEGKGYSGEVKGNIESAGVLRLTNLIHQDYTIFDTTNSLPIEDILKTPTIIELNAIENTDQKSLIIALILMSIFAYQNANQSLSEKGKLNYVILLEEAHVLLGSDKKAPAESGEALPNGMAIELINRILAEKRSSGLGMIVADQSPQKVTMDVIRNTNAKIIFRTVEQGDREVIAQCSNMTEEQKKSLSTLRTGEAYTFFGKVDTPQRIETPNFRSEKNVSLYIEDNELEKRIRQKRGGIPYVECALMVHCNGSCDFRTRAEAKYITDRIYQKYIANASNPRDSFLQVIKTVNDIIESIISRKLDGEMKKRVNNCVKLQLLRRVYLETDIEMELEMRQKFLSNPRYISL